MQDPIVTCPNCNKEIVLPRKGGHRTTRCPGCAGSITVLVQKALEEQSKQISLIAYTLGQRMQGLLDPNDLDYLFSRILRSHREDLIKGLRGE